MLLVGKAFLCSSVSLGLLMSTAVLCALQLRECFPAVSSNPGQWRAMSPICRGEESLKNLSSLFCSLAHAHSEACIVSIAIHSVGITRYSALRATSSDLILLHIRQVFLASLYSTKVPFSQPNRHFSF